MTRAEFAASTALIIANTKRLAKGLPPLSAPQTRGQKYKSRRKSAKKRATFIPPRAPEVVVEPCFKPTPPQPVRAVVRIPEVVTGDCPPPILFRVIDDAEAARWGILADGSLLDDRRPGHAA